MKAWVVGTEWAEAASFEAEPGLADVAISPNGALVACGGLIRAFLLDAESLRADAASHQILREFVGDHRKVSFSRDGRFLAMSHNRDIVLMSVGADDVEEFQVLRDPDLDVAHEGEYYHLEFNNSGSLLVSGAADRRIKLWDMSTGRLAATAVVHGTGNVYPAFSLDGRRLACTSDDCILLYDVGGLQEQSVVAQHPLAVRSIAFVSSKSPDELFLACITDQQARPDGTNRGEVTIWDLNKGQIENRRLLLQPASRPSNDIYALACHPTAPILAYSTLGAIHVWDLHRRSDTIPSGARQRASLSFSRDGMRLWGALDRTLVSWRIADLRDASQWASPLTKGPSSFPCVATGLRWVVLGSRDATVKLFHAGGGAPVKQWALDDPVQSVALNPNEDLIVAGTQTGRLWIIGISSGTLVELSGHTDSVESIAISRDGRLMATGSLDRSARLWLRDGMSFVELMTLPSPSGRPVIELRFSPDGKKLAVLARHERAVRVWHLDWLRERLAGMGLDW